MVPTVKRIQERFPKLTRKDALAVRRVLNNVEFTDGVRPALEQVSDIIGGFGVERIPQGHNLRSPAITYVNMGDTYDTTVIYINGHFDIGAWGDIVERGNYD